MWVMDSTLFFKLEHIFYLWVYTVTLIGFSYELGREHGKKKK
jgi:hypothetical protein